MAEVHLSTAAEADLLEIGADTRRTWGEEQAIRYIDALEVCCQMLAHNPNLGRNCDDLGRDLRRMEHGRHVVLLADHSWANSGGH